MNPTPQLSWSFCGSYSPVGPGTPEAFNLNEVSFAIMSFLLSAVAPMKTPKLTLCHPGRGIGTGKRGKTEGIPTWAR